MTPFKIVYDAGTRLLQFDDQTMAVRSSEELDVLDDIQLAVYARLATEMKNKMHKAVAGLTISPEAEHALRTVEWLAGETRRQLEKR